MDSLWKKDLLLQHDTIVFKYRDPRKPGLNSTAIYAQSDDLKGPEWLNKSERRTTCEWDAWFTEIADRSAVSKGNSIKIILCPRDDFERDHSAILKYLPFSSESFQTIAEGLELHHSLAVLVERGVPTISRVPRAHSVVYTLRTQHNMEGDMALTITYFKGATPPGHSKTHALLLGCSERDTDAICGKLGAARATAFSPFTLIKAFLELERGRRFRVVDKTVSEALRAAEQLPGGGKGQAGYGSYPPKSLVEAYTDAFMLRTALEAWRAQLAKLARYAAEDFTAAAGSSSSIHADDVDPAEYLEQLMCEYDIKIAHCERASLTFQVQTTELTRRDGREMRAISLLTMVFLPATFVATVMAVPTFDFGAITSIPQWSIYLVLFLPLTAVVLLVYFFWHRCLETSGRGPSWADLAV